MPGLRGARVGGFSEKRYDIIDAVSKIAEECSTDSSTAKLAWLKAQPGAQSTISGAQTLEQLDTNLKALDLTVAPQQIPSLNNVSKTVLNFPADSLAASPPMLMLERQSTKFRVS